MQYLALYRKFRPRTLSDVVRQEHIVKTLANQIESGKISHAYLFCGPRGTGKTSVAKIFAAAINCLNDKSGNPCGKCSACTSLLEPSSIDILEIDAASNNRVDEIRELKEKVKYPPVNVKYKVYIIDEVHMLTDQAFNALLKTLEEPPSHAVFVLATTEVHKLLPTILSRCMRFDFKLIPQDDIAKHIGNIFKEVGQEFEKEAVQEIARAGAGSIRDALSVAEVCLSYAKGKVTYSTVLEVLGSADFDAMFEIASAILSGDVNIVLNNIDILIKKGRSANILIKDLSDFLRNLLICATCSDCKNMLLMPKEYFNKLFSLSQGASLTKIIRALEVLNQTDAAMRFASSSQTLFESAAVKITLPELDYNIDALIARVAELENKLGELGEMSAVKTKKHSQAVKSTTVEQQAAQVQQQATQVQDNFEEEVAVTQAQAVQNTAIEKDKIWGQFNILLRQNKEFVLRTVMGELDASFNGQTLVIYVDTLQKYNILTKAENAQKIKEYLESLGCNLYELKMINAEEDDGHIEKIKQSFKNIKITVEKEM